MHKLKLIECCVDIQRNKIINNLSMVLASNKINAILGPNGTGKSTLFKSIIGQQNLTRGKILLDEMDITKFSLDQRIQSGLSYLPQNPSIFRQLTVKENLEIIQQRFTECQLEEIIEEFQLSKILAKKGHELSGGQRRIVEIARCISMQPKFVLLDEPYAGIDPKTINTINEILKKIAKNNIGIIITDHQAEKTINIADHTIILKSGSVLAEGTSETILRDQNVLKYYLGES